MPSALDKLTVTVTPCEFREECLNSPDHCGAWAACSLCKWAEAGGGPFNKWRPSSRKMKHPAVEAEKKELRRQKQLAREEQLRSRNRNKIRVQRDARRAEQATERKIIYSTLNSGRRSQDGDHVSAGRITLDTKLQTRRVNPVVDLAELEKVRADARRAGNPFGGLVLRNKDGRGVVVFDEEDYARLVSLIEGGRSK